MHCEGCRWVRRPGPSRSRPLVVGGIARNPAHFERERVCTPDITAVESHGVIWRDIQSCLVGNRISLKRGQCSWHDNPGTFGPGARSVADVLLDSSNGIKDRKGASEFTQSSFQRVDMGIDQPREHRPAAYVENLGPSTTLALQDRGIRSRRRDAPSFTAIASTTRNVASTVTALPLYRIRSASAAGAGRQRKTAANTRRIIYSILGKTGRGAIRTPDTLEAIRLPSRYTKMREAITRQFGGSTRHTHPSAACSGR
jgi:hypothetical protein